MKLPWKKWPEQKPPPRAYLFVVLVDLPTTILRLGFDESCSPPPLFWIQESELLATLPEQGEK